MTWHGTAPIYGPAMNMPCQNHNEWPFLWHLMYILAAMPANCSNIWHLWNDIMTLTNDDQ